MCEIEYALPQGANGAVLAEERNEELVFFKNEPSTSVLDSLKAGHLFLRYAIQKGVTIVQPGQDEGTNSVVALVDQESFTLRHFFSCVSFFDHMKSKKVTH